MSAPVMLRSNNTDLFGTSMLPVLQELFVDALAMHPSQREKLFKQVAHDRDIYQSSELHELELFSEIAEGSEYSYKRAKQGANKTLTIKKMGLGFSISDEMIADGKFDLVADMVRMLARSAKESQEVDGMNILNNGWGSENTADGLDIFHSAHTLPSGGTFRNRPSSDADLSEASLQTAITDFSTIFVGDGGIIKNLQPRYLVVHPSFKSIAMQLIGSDLQPDTAENNINTLKNEGLVVVSSPHITDLDSWFLTASPEQTGLRIVSRRGIETKSKEVFDNDAIKYKASYREALGCFHPNGVYGVQGA